MANPADDGLEGLFSSKNLYANVCLCPSTGVAPLLPFFGKHVSNSCGTCSNAQLLQIQSRGECDAR